MVSTGASTFFRISRTASYTSSQTKDTVTAVAMRRLQTELPPPGLTLETILDVPPDRLNELIWAVGFHNNKTRYIKATALILRDVWASDIPNTIEGMISLPGVGPKMAYLCMSAAWGRTEGIGVDVHVHRITNLWGWHKTRTPEETRMALQAWLPKEKWHEINHLLVGFGQTICLPVGRKCRECLLSGVGLCPSAVVGRRGKVVKRVVESKVVIKCEEAGMGTVEDGVATVEKLRSDIGGGDGLQTVKMSPSKVGGDDTEGLGYEVGYSEDIGESVEEMSEPDVGDMNRIPTPIRSEAEESPKTFISQLPNELLLQIFSHSPRLALKSARLTCKHWHHIVPPEHLFDKVLLSSTRQNIHYLTPFSSHPIYSKHVRKFETSLSRYGEQWPPPIDKRKDRHDAQSGLYVGEAGFHMSADTLRHIATGFSNIDSLDLDMLILGDEPGNKQALTALSTALASLRHLRHLHVEIGITRDREHTERALLADVLGSHIWPGLETLSVGGLCGPAASFSDLVLRHRSTIRSLTLCNVQLLDTHWRGLIESVRGHVAALSVLYVAPLLDGDGTDRSRRYWGGWPRLWVTA